jgi:hypothetical protein
MTININRLNNEWKAVKGNFTKEETVCPRCNNRVAYILSYDADGFGMPGILTFKYNKHYAYKCPICPNFEAVSTEVAKAIING